MTERRVPSHLLSAEAARSSGQFFSRVALDKLSCLRATKNVQEAFRESKNQRLAAHLIDVIPALGEQDKLRQTPSKLFGALALPAHPMNCKVSIMTPLAA